MTQHREAPDVALREGARRTPFRRRAAAGEPLRFPRRQGSLWLRRTLILIVAVLLADALFGDRGLARTIRTSREHAQALRALQDLRRENAGLRDQQRRLREDPRTIEGVARAELGLIRPGEILVIVKARR